ncbi:MAG TPA: hypothetical protein VFR23_05240 [Jiangellaceae bacterium]|nr:hypothetical protein [Jiangellaceae bacterium]
METSNSHNGERTRRHIWVQHVNVDADTLQTRVQAARARGLDPAQERIAEGVLRHVEWAREAANRKDPRPRWFFNWWRGTVTEAAYRQLHAARAQMVDLLEDDELPAELHGAVARAELSLPRDDPRRVSLQQLVKEPPERMRPFLRRLIDDSYQSLDGKHAQLRSFRNILLLTALIVAFLVGLTIAVVSWQPSWVPLCFPNEVVTDGATGASIVQGQNCPTSSGDTGPSSGDVLVVALLGALGGALTAAISIRNLKGTSTPYDVPVALAMLKIPLGAFTAILALVAIQGDFVPGLSVLDSQEQILAYALIFGFSQQLLTRLLDQRAQTLLEDLPGGEGAEPARTSAGLEQLKSWQPVTVGLPAQNGHARPSESADLPGDDLEMLSSDEPIVEGELEDEKFAPAADEDQVLEPDPLTGQGDDLQDEAVAEFTAADLSANLPAEDIEVVSNDEPVLEPADDDEELPAVVAAEEVVEPELLTDQGDEFQDDEADVQDIAPADEFSSFSSDQRG